MPKLRAAVVGGGIVGVAVARQLLLSGEAAEVALYEKELSLAAHQTGRNSGVVHAGLYYEPGGLKATLCRRGVGLLQELTSRRHVPYEECGKVVVARDDVELARLRTIFDRAVANGVPGVRMIDGAELRRIEPHARGIAALHSPTTAITNYAAATRAMADDFTEAGGTVFLGSKVTGIDDGHGNEADPEETTP